MSDEKDDDEKTEEPTARRLEQAREKGQIATSREVAHGSILLALTAIIALIVPLTFPPFLFSLSYFLEQSYQPVQGQILLLHVGKLFGETFGFAALMIVMAAFGAGFIQTRLNISTESLKPKFSKLSPAAGFKRLFGMKGFVDFLKNCFKIFLVMVLTVWILKPQLYRLGYYFSLNTQGLISSLHEMILLLFCVVLLLTLLLAGADYGWQKFQMTKTLRMTPQEIKEEYKEQEGDPHIKGRLRQLRQEKANQRMMQNVPGSTIVITNPTHYAIALKYEPEAMAAPRVVAKGIDAIALRIREVATSSEVPLVENPTLARALYASVDIDEEIPLEYYEVVAKIIRQLLLKGDISLKF